MSPAGCLGEKNRRKKVKLWHCPTFDIEDLFHKESHNSYSHFSVQIYGAILAIVSGGRMCVEAMLLLRFCGFQVVIIHLSPANNISSACKKKIIFSFFNYFSLSEDIRLTKMEHKLCSASGMPVS